MSNRIEAVPGVNGTAPQSKAKKPAARPVASALTAARIKFWATITMGVLLPLLSLGLSSVGGNLARHNHYALAAFALVLMTCVLVVSLSHLAWAIGDITRSPSWACWLLAVAFDLLLVLGEFCHVGAEHAGVGLVTSAMMGVVCLPGVDVLELLGVFAASVRTQTAGTAASPGDCPSGRLPGLFSLTWGIWVVRLSGNGTAGLAIRPARPSCCGP
jgi:hypothetical protein